MQKYSHLPQLEVGILFSPEICFRLTEFSPAGLQEKNIPEHITSGKQRTVTC